MSRGPELELDARLGFATVSRGSPSKRGLLLLGRDHENPSRRLHRGNGSDSSWALSRQLRRQLEIPIHPGHKISDGVLHGEIWDHATRGVVVATDGLVVAHEREIYPKFGVGKGEFHHSPRGIAVVAAGGFFPDEGGAMMGVGLGQEFRRRRERPAVDQDVDGPSERRLSGLLKAQVGMVECVDPAIASELGLSLRDSEVIVVVGVLWKKTETPFIPTFS